MPPPQPDVPPELVRSGVPRPSALLAGLVLVAFVALGLGYASLAFSEDLRALWLAAGAIAGGRPDLVYPPDTTAFTLRPPGAWLATLAAEGYRGSVYPYVYPPLWPALLAPFTGVMSFETFARGASLANVAALTGMVLLARQLAAPRMSLALYLALGGWVIYQQKTGMGALLQNQPQIAVAFLVVLALHQGERGHPLRAGLALALAAALKVSPALLALLWLASGHRRAFAAFAGFGAALAVLSVALAGWPLHAAFLHELGLISRTVLVTRNTFAVDAPVAMLLHPDRLALVHGAVLPEGSPGSTWHEMAKTPGLRALTALWLVASLALSAWLLHRAQTVASRAAIWPAAMILMTLAGPIAWGYHFLAPFAFVPMLADRLGLWRGGAAAAFLVLILTVDQHLPQLASETGQLVLRIVAPLGLVALAAICLVARNRRASAAFTPQ